MADPMELADAALEALLATWQAEGKRAIATVRTLDPATYVKIVARVAGQSGWSAAEDDVSGGDIAMLLRALAVDREAAG